MNIIEALQALKNGKKIQDKNRNIVYVSRVGKLISIEGHCIFISVSNLNNDDWELVPELTLFGNLKERDRFKFHEKDYVKVTHFTNMDDVNFNAIRIDDYVVTHFLDTIKVEKI